MNPLNEQDRADLVAYLDGELDEASAQVVEARLSTDPKFRAEADALERTWELLDFLPRPEPSTSFTHKTLERLQMSGPVQAARSSPSLAVAGRRSRSWFLGVGWAAAVLLPLGGGLLAAQFLWPPQAAVENPEHDELLVRSLRVIENKHLYDPIDDLEYLRALDHPDLFGEESAGG